MYCPSVADPGGGFANVLFFKKKFKENYEIIGPVGRGGHLHCYANPSLAVQTFCWLVRGS